MDPRLLRNHLRDNLLSFDFEFDSQVWDTFEYQYNCNEIYAQFCNYLDKKPQNISSISDIPFLPISAFKDHRVQSGIFNEKVIFKSSGTTQDLRSQHFVQDIDLYNQISVHLFESVYGSLEEICVLALLPSYLEQGDSSLIHMVSHFIHKSGHASSGFYKYNFSELAETVDALIQKQEKVLVIGVSYALLDFSEVIRPNWSDRVLVMETGGMKGRKKEMVRSELHQILKQNLKVDKIHSEYGMTEMMSQLYSTGNGYFHQGKTVQLRAYEMNDPLTPEKNYSAGRNYIIDLGNIDSCAFIASQDIIRLHHNDTIDILGRMDHSDVRGCNLLYV